MNSSYYMHLKGFEGQRESILFAKLRPLTGRRARASNEESYTAGGLERYLCSCFTTPPCDQHEGYGLKLAGP